MRRTDGVPAGDEVDPGQPDGGRAAGDATGDEAAWAAGGKETRDRLAPQDRRAIPALPVLLVLPAPSALSVQSGPLVPSGRRECLVRPPVRSGPQVRRARAAGCGRHHDRG
ncbi:hypothetical protein GCM10010300_80080 [Streptomyces olivaceoviridis]|nr:hypothetical protein GCM10010300_80080 [Streptomyces olivaceoviridis]